MARSGSRLERPPPLLAPQAGRARFLLSFRLCPEPEAPAPFSWRFTHVPAPLR